MLKQCNTESIFYMSGLAHISDMSRSYLRQFQQMSMAESSFTIQNSAELLFRDNGNKGLPTGSRCRPR